jgi:hypothetical protein
MNPGPHKYEARVLTIRSPRLLFVVHDCQLVSVTLTLLSVPV